MPSAAQSLRLIEPLASAIPAVYFVVTRARISLSSREARTWFFTLAAAMNISTCLLRANHLGVPSSRIQICRGEASDRTGPRLPIHTTLAPTRTTQQHFELLFTSRAGRASTPTRPPISSRSSTSRSDMETALGTQSLRGSRSHRDTPRPPWQWPRSSAGLGRCRSLLRSCRSGKCPPRNLFGSTTRQGSSARQCTP